MVSPRSAPSFSSWAARRQRSQASCATSSASGRASRASDRPGASAEERWASKAAMFMPQRGRAEANGAGSPAMPVTLVHRLAVTEAVLERRVHSRRGDRQGEGDQSLLAPTASRSPRATRHPPGRAPAPPGRNHRRGPPSRPSSSPPVAGQDGAQLGGRHLLQRRPCPARVGCRAYSPRPACWPPGGGDLPRPARLAGSPARSRSRTSARSHAG